MLRDNTGKQNPTSGTSSRKSAKTLGPGHPQTLMTRSRLARAVAAQGRFDEAATLYLETYPTLVELLGTDHPETWAVSQAMATLPKTD